jgi:hypothetical protein
LVRDEFEQAASLLKAGIARNHENLPLNRDMQLVLEQIARVQAGAAAGSDAGDANSQHFLVSTYRKH